MKQIDQLLYVKNLIVNFRIPQCDKLDSFWFSKKGNKSKFRSAIYISIENAPNFYRDIFEFWVRSFFCFVEDFALGSVFLDYNNILCQSDSINEFSKLYFSILRNDTPNDYSVERQSFPETYVELEKRDFSDSYVMFDTAFLKSYVAKSNASYVAIFRISLGTRN